MLPKMRILTIFAILLPVTLAAISNGDVPLHKNANISQMIAEHMKMLNLKLDPLTNQSETEEFDYKNMLRIKEILDVFSITNLAENWNKLRSEFTSNCSEDMTHYFNGMSIGRIWAAKSKSYFISFFPCHEKFRNSIRSTLNSLWSSLLVKCDLYSIGIRRAIYYDCNVLKGDSFSVLFCICVLNLFLMFYF